MPYCDKLKALISTPHGGMDTYNDIDKECIRVLQTMYVYVLNSDALPSFYVEICQEASQADHGIATSWVLGPLQGLETSGAGANKHISGMPLTLRNPEAVLKCVRGPRYWRSYAPSKEGAFAGALNPQFVRQNIMRQGNVLHVKW